MSEEGFQLGKKLFYDGRLSIDGNYPCSSCHQQVAAFTTFEHDRSHGYQHSHTLRNAPALSNLAWYPVLNQDGSARSLEEISLGHIIHPTEMAENLPSVIKKLKADNEYRNMFRAAYGTDNITAERMLNALSQFVVSMVSANSKYDRMKRGEAVFTAQEQSGYAIFQQNCSSCHKEPLFTDFSFRNTGLVIDDHLKDFGRMRVTGKKEDSLKFRVPSLRNVELSSNYGHDGRFITMRDMIRHYRFDVVPSPTVDPQIANGIPLTQAQENDLVIFLRTLSDSSYLTNPRYGQ